MHLVSILVGLVAAAVGLTEPELASALSGQVPSRTETIIAPNGKLIIYASEIGGRGILAAVSSDGRVKQRLTAAASDVREPAWGPLPR